MNTNKELPTTIKSCFKEILSSQDQEYVQRVAKQVTKIVYSNVRNSRKIKYKEEEIIIQNAENMYKQINKKEIWRQELFVRCVSVIYWSHAKPNRRLINWLFELIQHPNGHIRYYAVKMFKDKLIELTIPYREALYKARRKGKQLNASDILRVIGPKNGRILLDIYNITVILLNAYDKPEYSRYKYINKIPSSVFKSLQMLMAHIIDLCGKDFVDMLDNQRAIFIQTIRQTT